MTRWVGIALFGAAAGEWGAVMFATIPATFFLASIGLLDMVYTAFLFGGMGCLLVAMREQRPRVELAGYALLTLAVMTKGPVALLLVGLFCTGAWLAGGELRESVARLRWKTGLLLVAVAASPWFVYMYARFGDAFVQGYVLAGNLYYFTQPASFSGRAVSHVYYARVVAGGFFPWSVILVGRLLDLAFRRRTAPPWSTEEKLLWLWAAVVIGFFSVARFKLDHYIFPAAPALCMIAAQRLAGCDKPRARPLVLHPFRGHVPRLRARHRRHLHERLLVRARSGTARRRRSCSPSCWRSAAWHCSPPPRKRDGACRRRRSCRPSRSWRCLPSW